MNDLRRTVLWVVFSMSLVLLWDAWSKHNGHPSMFSPSPRPAATAPATDGPPQAGASPALGGAGGTVPTPTATGTAAATPPATVGAAAAATPTVTIETDMVRATVDARGGDVVRLELLKQVDQEDRSRNVVLFDRSATRVYLAQTGLIGAPGLPNHLTTYTIEPGPRSLQAGQDAVTVVLTAPEQGGLTLKKSLTFQRGSYVVKVQHAVVNAGGAALPVQLYEQLVRDGNVDQAHHVLMGPQSFTGSAIYTERDKFQKVDFKAIDKGESDHAKSAEDGWVAMVQHYFVSAWLDNDKRPRDFYTRKVDNNLYAVGVIYPLGTLEPGATRTIETTLYAGPQEETRLEALSPGLERVKDYGMFHIIAKPLFWVLEKLHGVLGNWGWSIVALVVLIKAAFFSLNAHAYKSMAKQKAITPKITALRERLKDKPQQMQQEMMRIYKEEKVNPLGSCLPILVQMPVFFALYWVLLSSVEMRNAPWIGWITDLSVKDPLYILPIVMTGTSLLQTWLNPTPPDPVQAKMMWIMPLVFSVMFFVFPAGLVLYWITNNALSILQQYVINKRLGVS